MNCSGIADTVSLDGVTVQQQIEITEYLNAPFGASLSRARSVDILRGPLIDMHFGHFESLFRIHMPFQTPSGPLNTLEAPDRA
jgi:hypothetical protein